MPDIIDEVVAYVFTEQDGTEGIPAVLSPKDGMFYPLIGADGERIMSLFPLAQQIADERNAKLEVVRFGARQHLEWIEPRGANGT